MIKVSNFSANVSQNSDAETKCLKNISQREGSIIYACIFIRFISWSLGLVKFFLYLAWESCLSQVTSKERRTGLERWRQTSKQTIKILFREVLVFHFLHQTSNLKYFLLSIVLITNWRLNFQPMNFYLCIFT